MIAAFVLIVSGCLIGDVAWWLWADAHLRRTRHPKVWRPLLGLWCGLLLGYLLFFIIFPREGRHAHAWMPIWALATIYVWHLLVLPVVVLLLSAAGLVRAARMLWRRVTRRRAAEQPVNVKELSEALAMAPARPSRRQLLVAAAVAAPPLAAVGAVARAMGQVGHFRIRRYELPFANLPPQLDGMTIAQVSDIHVGRFTRAEVLPAIADATNQLKADLVLLTGDLIDLTLADLPAGLNFVKSLDPRSGLFMIEGNHDLIEDPDGFVAGVRQSGVPLLRDESVIVTVRGVPLQLLGITWQRRGDAGIVGSMSRIIPQRRPDLFQILMAHHPHAFDPAAAVGIPLILSGHTHGGQIMLNERMGMGPVMFRYWSGLYRRKDSTMVVSNGIGNWFPLRLNAPAEIVHLTLRRSS